MLKVYKVQTNTREPSQNNKTEKKDNLTNETSSLGHLLSSTIARSSCQQKYNIQIEQIDPISFLPNLDRRYGQLHKYFLISILKIPLIKLTFDFSRQCILHQVLPSLQTHSHIGVTICYQTHLEVLNVYNCHIRYL
jgi:hypothetical protein